jgi:hypothetical protein
VPDRNARLPRPLFVLAAGLATAGAVAVGAVAQLALVSVLAGVAVWRGLTGLLG